MTAMASATRTGPLKIRQQPAEADPDRSKEATAHIEFSIAVTR